MDEPGGMFLGGFYSRATRNGCESKITAHPPAYFDYSDRVSVLCRLGRQPVLDVAKNRQRAA